MRINGILLDWVNNPLRERKMIWLYGFAGTGKTALVQTFAETCLADGRLGASYFFSRTDGRTKADPVILTLIYHLTVHCPVYGSIVATIISEDLSTLYKSRRSQMRQLIVEPFLLLRKQEHQITQEPLLIVLDGLDECEDIDAQRELIEMICEVLRQEPELPLLWLIASRPEPDLEPLSWREDLISVCSSLQVVDEDTRDDISRYLQDSFSDIRSKFPYVTSTSWPSEQQFNEIVEVVSGTFVRASTIIQYVGKSTNPNPMGRLVEILTAMKEGTNPSIDEPNPPSVSISDDLPKTSIDELDHKHHSFWSYRFFRNWVPHRSQKSRSHCESCKKSQSLFKRSCSLFKPRKTSPVVLLPGDTSNTGNNS